ncbi:acyl-CoA dehydrogenase family protein [Bartonella sp. HY406]|uniref:acyl-CoA dehydrogenase family protein n=1 Tax=Bartonella sp. HY406 TaxID=2979331 RepID=UPI0021C75CAA|nr:acyl-CoA dehydrogenase family protein [Bartonella sp. HY406]UXN05021.1 acyl-CoA/acyl-ACP dehydrogenase [Bartonella sp. HY406]
MIKMQQQQNEGKALSFQSNEIRHGLTGLDYFSQNANSLDEQSDKADEILPQLLKTGAIGIGVTKDFGGDGGTICDSVEAIAALSYHSLTAAFVLWVQKTYAHFLIESDNEQLRIEQLPQIINGSLAGASALSNAMKFMAGLETLQIKVSAETNGKTIVDGIMPWVTNLRLGNFVIAAAIERADKTAFVASFAADDLGLTRSDDLDLTALRASHTASISLKNVQIDQKHIIFHNLAASIAPVRPGFIGMQCAMSLGLARRILDEAQHNQGAGRNVLNAEIDTLTSDLVSLTNELQQGLIEQQFISDIAALFRIRIRLADLVTKAIWLELQTLGGKAYLQKTGSDFARRLREAAFIPIITPSITQLKAVLQAQNQ